MPFAESPPERLIDQFRARFGATPQVYRAPGRVNLIGEHTDYNDGFVMPAAIGFYTYVAIAPRADRKLCLLSENFCEEVELDLDRIPSHGSGGWSAYITGVAWALAQAGVAVPGANLLVSGDVPLNAGLSSSASVEMAASYALADLARHPINLKALALLCQRAENEFVGARCGIMDQFVSAHGRPDHALMLDCRTLEYRLLPLPDSARLVICNSMIKHSVAQGEYNARRAECEEGVRILASCFPAIKALRDAGLDQLAACHDDMPDTIARRCRHVITENLRVQRAAEALNTADLKTFGHLMTESHASMRDDYEISCPEIDLLVQLAGRVPGVYGSRMTGGGFGGCTVNLVAAGSVESFSAAISEQYQRATKLKPDVYVCSAADGAARVA
jgi:galactokinase